MRRYRGAGCVTTQNIARGGGLLQTMAALIEERTRRGLLRALGGKWEGFIGGGFEEELLSHSQESINTSIV